MQWWTDFLNWLNSDSGWRIVSTVVIPFVAIVVAGIAAAGIGRASARKVIELSEREVRASAVTALISAARKAAVWNTLPAPEQQHIDHLIGDAEIRLRLLPIAGTALAADWARHEIAGMKRNAISFSFQAEQSLLVFRDRLIEWQGRPSRAKKLFKNDLDSWAYDSSASEQELVHQQQKWAAEQVTETGPAGAASTAATPPPVTAAATQTPVTASPFTRPPSPAPIAAPLVESTAAVQSTAATAAAAAVTAAGAASAAPGQSASGPSETVVRADEEPPPLVEPGDTSTHDASDASIFADRGAPDSAEDYSNSDHGEPTRDGHGDGENPGEIRDGNRTDDSSAGGPAGSSDGSESQDGDHDHETDESGDGKGDGQHGEHQHAENQEHGDHEHGDHEHDGQEHDGQEHHDHNHEEWRG